MRKLILGMMVLMASFQMAMAQTGTTELYLTCPMDCKGCETKISDQLRFEKGVKDLAVDHVSKTVKVVYKTDKNSQEQILKSLKKIGYDATVISAEKYAELKKTAVDTDEHEH